MYTLLYHPLFPKDLQVFSKPMQKKILFTIQSKLSSHPKNFGIALHQELQGYYRLRIGAYRVIYRITEDTVSVYLLHLGDRKDDKVYMIAKQRVSSTPPPS